MSKVITACQSYIFLITLVTLFQASKSFSTPELIQTEGLDLEEPISKTLLSSTCGLILFQQELLELKPFQRPAYIYRVSEETDFSTLKITSECNIVVIIGLGREESLEKYETFVGQNFWRISLVLVFPMKIFKLEDLKSLPWSMIWYKHLMLIESTGKVVGDLRAGICSYEDPNCLLRETSLRIGFTGVRKIINRLIYKRIVVSAWLKTNIS